MLVNQLCLVFLNYYIPIAVKMLYPQADFPDPPPFPV